MEKLIEILKKITDIEPLLAKLKTGSVVRMTFSIAYRVLAVLLALLLAYAWFKLWSAISGVNFFGGIALIIWQLTFPIAAFLSVKTLYIRAREIAEYPDSDYVIVPIIATLIRTTGEMVFVFLAAISLPAIILTWLTQGMVTDMFDFVDTGNLFLSGIYAFIMCWVVGFFTMVISMFITEWTLAIFSIASDVSILRKSKTSQALD